MKKFAMLALAMSLFLVACGQKNEEKPVEQPVAAEAQATTEEVATEVAPVAEAVVLEATTEDGKVFTVSIVDGVATVTDEAGLAYELPVVESADGEKYADEAGNEIHLKGDEGIVSLGDVKEATVTVVTK